MYVYVYFSPNIRHAISSLVVLETLRIELTTFFDTTTNNSSTVWKQP